MKLENIIEKTQNYEDPAGIITENLTSRSKRAAIYVRISNKDQETKGYSIAAQLESLRSYCLAMDWQIAGEYIDDGYGARNVNRPRYRKMFKELFRWDILLVFKLDRIHQNINNFYKMMENLNDWGKGFVSLQDSIDTSTMFGKSAMDLVQAIAQLEDGHIDERINLRLRNKARKALRNKLLFHPSNNVPYGYSRENGEVITKPSEAKVVKEIFLLYSNGISITKIVNWLNENNITTKHNRKFGRGSVLTILKDPFYCGYHNHKNYLFKADHDPIIGIKLYNRAQKIQMKSIINIKLCKSIPKLIDANQGELISCS